MCWIVCQRGLFSLFASPMLEQKVPQGSCTLCHQNCLGSPWPSGESSFWVSQASASLPSEESHTLPQSGRNKFIFYLFSSSLLIGKTGAFLLSEPCSTLLSSVLSLPQEKNWTLFPLAGLWAEFRLVLHLFSLCVMNSTCVMCSGLVGIPGAGWGEAVYAVLANL